MKTPLPTDPTSGEDENANTNKSKSDAQDEEERTASQYPPPPVEKENIEAEHKQGTANKTEEKASVAQRFWQATPDTKNLIVNSTMVILTAIMAFLTLVMAAIGMWQAYIAQAALQEARNGVIVAEKQWKVADETL